MSPKSALRGPRVLGRGRRAEEGAPNGRYGRGSPGVRVGDSQMRASFALTAASLRHGLACAGTLGACELELADREVRRQHRLTSVTRQSGVSFRRGFGAVGGLFELHHGVMARVAVCGLRLRPLRASSRTHEQRPPELATRLGQPRPSGQRSRYPRRPHRMQPSSALLYDAHEQHAMTTSCLLGPRETSGDRQIWAALSCDRREMRRSHGRRGRVGYALPAIPPAGIPERRLMTVPSKDARASRCRGSTP